MNTPAPYAKRLMQAVATAGRGIACAFQRPSEAVSGPAPTPTASQQPRPAGAALLTQRLILQAAARDARNLRRSKQASTLERELRNLTTAILRGRP